MLFLAVKNNFFSGLVDAEQGWCCSQEQEEVIKCNFVFYG
jgi:hypothetical protein